MSAPVQQTNTPNSVTPINNGDFRTSRVNGLSSFPSSISSAKARTTQNDFSTQISAWVASVVDAIRACLARLPLIGGWFEVTPPVTTTTPTTPVPPPRVQYTDAENLNMVVAQFPRPSTTTQATPPATPPVTPNPQTVDYVVNEVFNRIASPAIKMQAFEAVLTAPNSTDAIARQFYDALPAGTDGVIEASKATFKHYIWLANGSSDEGRGIGYGEHMVSPANIRHLRCQQAAHNLSAALTPATNVGTHTPTGGGGS